MDPIKKLNAGCQEILELLDAYALGAVDKAEAAEVERPDEEEDDHVALLVTPSVARGLGGRAARRPAHPGPSLRSG